MRLLLRKLLSRGALALLRFNSESVLQVSRNRHRSITDAVD